MAPKGRRDRKRQTKLNFSPTSATPPRNAPRDKPSATSPTRAPQTALSMPTKASSRIKMEVDLYSSSEDELAGGMNSYRSKLPEKPGMFASSGVNKPLLDSSSDEDLGNKVSMPQPASRKRRRAQESSEEDEGSSKTTVKKAKQKRHQRTKAAALDSDDDWRTPSSKRRRTVAVPQVESDEESDEVVAPASTKRRRLARRRVSSNDDDEANDRSGTDGGSAEDEEDEKDAINSEGDDLREDLAFLRSSPLPDRGKLRSTQKKPMNERQKALVALRQRRAGNQEPSSSATPSRQRRVIVDSESDSELEIIKEEPNSDEDAEDDQESEEQSDREANALDMFLEDKDDEEFIDDDEGGQLGEPVLDDDDFMPLIVARMSMAKPKDLFKYAIEWMVMKKIHPAFDSKSKVYEITFKKLEDEVQGLANSKFSSSAWTPDFTRAIRARPDLNIAGISRIGREFMAPHCEACNRKNHPASQELALTGRPYDNKTLEPIEGNPDDASNSSDSNDSSLSADSEDEADIEKPTYNANGERIPPESKRFMLGSTCAANAQVAHTLHHWRYHLYTWVKDYLAREGHLATEKIVKREKMTDKKRDRAARKIVKRMEEGGEIKKLYKQYKEQVDFAFEAANEQRNGWGRRR